MQKYDYVIIGGGPAGIGVLEELINSDRSSVLLLEARDSLGYTLTWMSEIPFHTDGGSGSGGGGSDSGPGSVGRAASTAAPAGSTGLEFKKDFIDIHHDSPQVKTGSRVFSIDFSRNRLHYIGPDKEKETVEFSHLFAAPGAVQVLFGRHLLPGNRTSRLFTTYQAGEMLRHYPFAPGKRVIFYGNSPYTIETALAAHRWEIAEAVVVPGPLDEGLSSRLPDIPVYETAGIRALTGDAFFEGLQIETPEGLQTIEGDALTVDGDFVLELEWRNLLGVKWDLHNKRTEVHGQTEVQGQEERAGAFTLIGDALAPEPNFYIQYARGRTAAHEILRR